jgi:SH3 domain-containing protein
MRMIRFPACALCIVALTASGALAQARKEVPLYEPPLPFPSESLRADHFPMEGRSLGATVRQDPSDKAPQVATLRKGEKFTILERAGNQDGYSWFKISFAGRTGFLWGRTLCAEDPIRGVREVCKP